jgi:hypothetical protein
VPIGEQDHHGVAVTVASELACRVDQPVDFRWCQVFPAASFGAVSAYYGAICPSTCTKSKSEPNKRQRGTWAARPVSSVSSSWPAGQILSKWSSDGSEGWILADFRTLIQDHEAGGMG